MVSCVAKSQDEIPWRCVKLQSTVMCTAVLETPTLYENALLVKQHSHPADQTAVVAEQSPIHEAQSKYNDKPNQIFTFSAATAPNEVKARLPAASLKTKRLLQYFIKQLPRNLHGTQLHVSVLAVQATHNQTTKSTAVTTVSHGRKCEPAYA